MYQKCKRFFIYAMWWWLAMIIDIGFLYYLTTILHTHYLLSQIISFSIGFTVGFLYQKHITFHWIEGNTLHQLMTCLLIQVIWLGINLIILFVLVDFLWIYYIYWAVISKWLVFIWNYYMNWNYNFIPKEKKI